MEFLASIVDLSKEIELMPDDVLVVRTPDDVLVVRDYVSVFLKDLPRLPSDREIMFSIELVPGSTLILRALYQLVPTELKELKVQL